MASALVKDLKVFRGFSFKNYKRNVFLETKGVELQEASKTGTTIAGVIFKDGVVLGADTRATIGPTVVDKNCSKIHYLARNIYSCGAGVTADIEMTTKLMASQLALHQLNTGRLPRVCAARTMLKQYLYRYHGYICTELIIGGVDVTGPHLYTVHPHGSTNTLPFATMGSGELAAMAVLESRYLVDLSVDEAVALVCDAIKAGIFNDLGSGSNVDLCVLSMKDLKVETKPADRYSKVIRTYEEPCVKGPRQGNYEYKPGTTEVLCESTEILKDDAIEVRLK